MEPAAVSATVLPVATQVAVVRRAAAGDATAFERLVEARADRSFRIARAILGNDAEASDATLRRRLTTDPTRRPAPRA
jgi:hypothetical protein